ncbi:hypothetical protein ACOMHN_056953 [Nucella lapillus]
MAGRNDDVSKAPRPNKKRPLSAVLEEFEIEESELREHLNNNNNNDDDDDGSLDGSVCHDRRKHSQNMSMSPARTDTDVDGSVGTNTATSSSTSVSVSSLKALFEAGNVRTPEQRQPSPKFPRKLGGPKFGRRSPRSPNLSPKIPRRDSSGRFTSSSDVRDSGDDMPPTTTSDMTRLRQMAERLCLSTRRPSVQQWQAQFAESAQLPVLQDCGKSDVMGKNDGEGGRWTAEWTERINSALDWIKNELQEMRSQDQQLARQLLALRGDLHRLKLARSCEEHQDMLDDLHDELQELQEFADVLDLPTPTLTHSPLQHLGVTRMNFSARRFSTC